jgi:hypothetical protein
MSDTTNPKDALGVKKISVTKIPPSAILEMARAMENGATKYGPQNYRDTYVRTTIYLDAAIRHIFSYFDGEENAEDSGCTHLGHAMASLGIIIDAAECGTLIDDRPTKGTSSRMIDRYNKGNKSTHVWTPSVSPGQSPTYIRSIDDSDEWDLSHRRLSREYD